MYAKVISPAVCQHTHHIVNCRREKFLPSVSTSCVPWVDTVTLQSSDRNGGGGVTRHGGEEEHGVKGGSVAAADVQGSREFAHTRESWCGGIFCYFYLLI